MKIAVIHSFYSDRLPSGENTVVNMQVDALRQAGHEVRLVATRTDDLAVESGYKLRTAINVMTGSGIDPTGELEKFSPDVIHIHNLFPNFSTKWLASWVGPVVVTVHNFRPVCASGILFRDGETCTLCPDGSQLNSIRHGCYRKSRVASLPIAIRNRNGLKADPLLARADHVIFLSNRSKESYESFGFRTTGTSVIPNFVDFNLFEIIEKPSPKEWIYVGRLAPEKGIIKLLMKWPKSEPINVYGDGPDFDIAVSLASKTIRIHGLKARNEVLKAISEAQGLVIPSTCAENFPTVYAEALAAGIPVVGRSGNAASDDILISKSGRVFQEWEEIPDLVDYVNNARKELSAAARSRYEQKFMKESWIRTIASVYADAKCGG